MTISNVSSYLVSSQSAVSSAVSSNTSSPKGSAAANASVDKAFTSTFQTGGAAVADWDGDLCPRIPKVGPPHGPLGGIDLNVLSGQIR